MAQTLYIQLNNLGGNTGPFNLYSVDINGVETLIQSNVPKSQLIAGLLLTNIPNNAVKIKVQSTSALCSSFSYINIPYPTTSTTTLPLTTTTTTSSTVVTNCNPLYFAKGILYSYDVATNSVTPLFVPGITGSTVNYLDIAHTANKLWFVDFRNNQFIEFNITLNTWSATFSQNILWPPGFVSSAGLHAINNTTLLVVDQTTSTVVEFNTLNGAVTTKFTLPSTRGVTGDFILTTTNKFIVLLDDGTDSYISQYDYATGVLEFDKKLNPTIPFPYGLFESGNLVYITDASNGIYTIGASSPNTITRIGYPTNANPNDIVLGASQIGSCITQQFSNNITTTTTLTAVPTTSSTTISPSTTSTTTVPPCGCYTITNLETDPTSTYQLTIADCTNLQDTRNNIFPGTSTSWCGTGAFSVIKNPGSRQSTWRYNLIFNGVCGASCPPVPTTTSTTTVTPTTTASPTTSTTTITPSTTTTTTIPCNCLTFTNTSYVYAQQAWYKDCTNTYTDITLDPKDTIQVCGSNPGAIYPKIVNIITGAACVLNNCPATTSTTTLPVFNTCEEVVFNNTDLINSGTVVYIDCSGTSIILTLLPGATSANICLIGSSVVVSNSAITTTIVNTSCITSPTTSTTTLSPTTSTTIAPTTSTTSTTSAFAGCAISPKLWSTKNLSVTTYANGDPIPQITDAAIWASTTTGAWCYYNNDASTEPIYGRLYNWYAVDDFRGLAPLGYHIATSGEWSALTTCVGNVASRLKSTSGWAAGAYGNGNNVTGFTALPGGYRSGSGLFTGESTSGYWWDGNNTSYNFMGTNSVGIISAGTTDSRIAMSVRIVQN